MKNKDKYHDQIFEIACSGHRFGMKFNGELMDCYSLGCDNCAFNGFRDCRETLKEWCEEEAAE